MLKVKRLVIRIDVTVLEIAQARKVKKHKNECNRIKEFST